MDRVSDIIEQLEQLEDLVTTTESVMPHASHKANGRPEVRSITQEEPLSQGLSHLHDSLMRVKRVVEEKETGICLLEGGEERLKSIDTDLQDIKRDMLLINHH